MHLIESAIKYSILRTKHENELWCEQTSQIGHSTCRVACRRVPIPIAYTDSLHESRTSFKSIDMWLYILAIMDPV